MVNFLTELFNPQYFLMEAVNNCFAIRELSQAPWVLLWAKTSYFLLYFWLFDKGSLWKWWPLYTILPCHIWSSADESILLDTWMDPTGSGSSISSPSKSLQSFSWVGDLGFHFFEENHSFRFLCHYHIIKPLTILLTKAAHDIWHKSQSEKSQLFPFFKASRSQVH